MRPLTAIERTLSLFTGLSDKESGDARDGTPAIPKPPLPKCKSRLVWRLEAGLWMAGPGRSETHRILSIGSSYVASAGGRQLGVFSTLIEAAEACEAAS